MQEETAEHSPRGGIRLPVQRALCWPCPDDLPDRPRTSVHDGAGVVLRSRFEQVFGIITSDTCMT